ncbi:MAG: 2-hydroxyacid dehydrogenase [Ruminococcus sp.]|nr:2-hydroxyacid dehydrogenase [Ruminococcus sp.]
MKTILLTNKYTDLPLSIVRQELPHGFEIVFLSDQTQAALVDQISKADYLLAGGRLRITAEVLEKAGRLRMIQRSGVGLDSLDLEAIKAKGIPLYVNRGVNAQSGAEHTLLLILACLRRLPVIAEKTKKGIWNKQGQGIRTSELRGKTVGIIGMGSIARALVSLLRPFNVRILYTDIARAPEDYESENNMCFVALDELLSSSDVVTLNCALTDKTRHLICAESICKMKPGAVLVNTARGEIVDSAALAEALKDGRIGFAGLDVHEEEPLPAGHIFSDLENVILTPHIAGVTADSFRAMMEGAFRNIDKFDKGELEEIEQYRYI